MPKEKVVLVTGACGFVGSHLVDQLLEFEDFEVRGTDLSTADYTFFNPACEFIPSDLRNPDSLHQVVQGVDLIYHTASLFRYSAAWQDLYEVNVEGTLNLALAASEAEVSKFENRGNL